MISLLRFVAMLSITNSHFGSLYPEGLSFIATGGTLGNSLFMFCSGYALYYSVLNQKRDNSKLSQPQKTYNWLTKRFLRIYPSLWLFRLFQVFILGATFKVTSLIIPGYWFLNALLLFYVIFYIIVNYFEKYIIKIVFIILVPYLIVFFCQENYNTEFIIEQTGNQVRLHWYYYFGIMLFGAIVNKYQSSLLKIKRWSGVMLLLFIVIYYGLKGFIINNQLYCLQFIIPILLFPIMLYSLNVARNIVTAHLYLKIENIVIFFSNITLDVYIVQFLIINFMSKFQFPLGWSFAWISILLSATILYLLSKQINNKLVSKLIIK